MDNSQIISADELHRHINDENWRVIDCRFDLSDSGAGHKSYLAGHIPGAAFADLNDDLAAPTGPGTGRHPLPSPESAAAFFESIGVGSSTRVVVYDSANGAMAARAWWMLRWLGHDAVCLLDGGYAAWTEPGYPVNAGTETFERKTFAPRTRRELVVSTDELANAGDGIAAMNLLDARDGPRFRGEVEPIDRVAGHIPGARNMPFVNNLLPDGRWKSRDERRALWRKHLGDDKSAASIAMCGSGVTACHLIVSAVDCGYREPRLYVGSWSEWIADPGRPIEPGAA